MYSGTSSATTLTNVGTTPQTVERALARLEAAFLDSTGAEAQLARRESGRDDPQARAARTAALVQAQQPDGSWGGSLTDTAELLLLLAELCDGEPDDDVAAAARHGMDWLRGRRGRPGRYGDGCSPERHRLGICEHFLGGFFAPEPPIPADRDLPLPCGAHIPAGPETRLVASCLALRSMLRWGRCGHDERLHLDGLRRLLAIDADRDGTSIAVDAVPAMLLALLEAPADPENPADHERTARALERIAGTQRADGSWPELDAFYILDVFVAAVDAGLRSPALLAAIRRSAELLAVTQQPDGLWEREATPRRKLIGWRALRTALRIHNGEIEADAEAGAAAKPMVSAAKPKVAAAKPAGAAENGPEPGAE